jgi:hypothetical protein
MRHLCNALNRHHIIINIIIVMMILNVIIIIIKSSLSSSLSSSILSSPPPPLSSLQERLTGVQYEGEKCNESAKVLSDTIRSRLKNLGFQRYKFVVQVVIGERREQGIRYVIGVKVRVRAKVRVRFKVRGEVRVRVWVPEILVCSSSCYRRTRRTGYKVRY